METLLVPSGSLDEIGKWSNIYIYICIYIYLYKVLFSQFCGAIDSIQTISQHHSTPPAKERLDQVEVTKTIEHSVTAASLVSTSPVHRWAPVEPQHKQLCFSHIRPWTAGWRHKCEKCMKLDGLEYRERERESNDVKSVRQTKIQRHWMIIIHEWTHCM